jgi:hypothetical protein
MNAVSGVLGAGNVGPRQAGIKKLDREVDTSLEP